MKKNERKHASLYVLNIYWKKRQKNENKENISINWRIKQPKERKKKKHFAREKKKKL